MNQTCLRVFSIAALLFAQGCTTPAINAASTSLESAPAQSEPGTPTADTTQPASVRPRPRVEPLVATGYAVISAQNHKVPAQQRLLAIRAAKLDAYRNLAEQVYGLRLDSSTSVAEMAVQNDRFRGRVEGVIFGAVLTNITPTTNDTYEVTLTLENTAVNDIRSLYVEKISARSGHN